LLQRCDSLHVSNNIGDPSSQHIQLLHFFHGLPGSFSLWLVAQSRAYDFHLCIHSPSLATPWDDLLLHHPLTSTSRETLLSRNQEIDCFLTWMCPFMMHLPSCCPNDNDLVRKDNPNANTDKAGWWCTASHSTVPEYATVPSLVNHPASDEKF
jgi:hypothetical protein